MEYIRKTLDFKVKEPSVITLGKFDGLHRGHELLMDEILRQSVENNYKSIVFTFDFPPRNTVENTHSSVITTNDEKFYIFEKTGIDYLIECPFTKEVMNLEAKDFIAWIVGVLNVKSIVVGTDFAFGHKRSGNVDVLKQYEDEFGYKTVVLDKMQDNGRDISSTYIREELMAGRIEKANMLLGYEFFFKSSVIHGNQIGRKMGVPTINMAIDDDKILPPFGVYVSRVIIGDNWYMGVSNIGKKPTVSDDNPVGIETYILDFCQDVYEKELVVELMSFLRPEKKFDSLDQLQQQISEDVARTHKYYRNVT